MASRFEKTIISKGFHIENLNEFFGKSPIFLFIAVFVFIIAKVVKRGVVIQNEIDLTV
jgi:hypothetical protein